MRTKRLNTVCQGCGYADPRHHPDPERGRQSLQLHGRYTGRCPITGTSIDEPQLGEKEKL